MRECCYCGVVCFVLGFYTLLQALHDRMGRDNLVKQEKQNKTEVLT